MGIGKSPIWKPLTLSNPGFLRAFMRGSQVPSVLRRPARVASATSAPANRTQLHSIGRTPIHPFVALVQRETRRATRTRCELSLVLFHVDAEAPDAAALADAVSAYLNANMRETDFCAIFGDTTVAVLLLETGAQGASVYMHKVLRELAMPGVTAVTHSYPDAAFNDLFAGHLGAHSLAHSWDTDRHSS
jgi:hypothetical protein